MISLMLAVVTALAAVGYVAARLTARDAAAPYRTAYMQLRRRVRDIAVASRHDDPGYDLIIAALDHAEATLERTADR